MPARAPWRRVAFAAQARGKALVALLVALAIAGAVAWWWLAPQTLPGPVRSLLPASPAARATVYRWRDAKGRLQLTQEPPADRPYETLRYDPNLNVVPSAGAAPAKP